MKHNNKNNQREKLKKFVLEKHYTFQITVCFNFVNLILEHLIFMSNEWFHQNRKKRKSSAFCFLLWSHVSKMAKFNKYDTILKTNI